MDSQPKTGKLKHSWLLTRAAWNGLKLDKELLTLPLISTVTGILFVGAIVLGLFAFSAWEIFFQSEAFVVQNNSSFTAEAGIKPAGMALFFGVGLVLSTIGTIASAAVIHAALARFRGEDPTISSSIGAAFKKIGPLAAFTAFSYTIGYVLSEIANRIPFLGGKIVAWLAQLAWSIASFFALPVIISSQEPVYPIQATKQSIKIFKQVWGESVIANGGIAIISLLTVLAHTSITIGGIALLTGFGAPDVITFIFAVLATLALILLLLTFSVLSGFVKAAIYYYATTGIAPDTFNQDLLKQSFTPKKARKVFGA